MKYTYLNIKYAYLNVKYAYYLNMKYAYLFDFLMSFRAFEELSIFVAPPGIAFYALSF